MDIDQGNQDRVPSREGSGQYPEDLDKWLRYSGGSETKWDSPRGSGGDFGSLPPFHEGSSSHDDLYNGSFLPKVKDLDSPHNSVGQFFGTSDRTKSPQSSMSFTSVNRYSPNSSLIFSQPNGGFANSGSLFSGQRTSNELISSRPNSAELLNLNQPVIDLPLPNSLLFPNHRQVNNAPPLVNSQSKPGPPAKQASKPVFFPYENQATPNPNPASPTVAAHVPANTVKSPPQSKNNVDVKHSDKIPKFDNTIFRQMHCDYNCLMTNHMKKLRAYNLNPSTITKTFELVINANEPGATNFGETFPRSLGNGTFDDKGIFNIPFVQQTTSNNKKKGSPTLMFQLEFRDIGPIVNGEPPVVFQSEWFFTVCQNTRAKKRYRKDVQADAEESINNLITNMPSSFAAKVASQPPQTPTMPSLRTTVHLPGTSQTNSAGVQQVVQVLPNQNQNQRQQRQQQQGIMMLNNANAAQNNFNGQFNYNLHGTSVQAVAPGSYIQTPVQTSGDQVMSSNPTVLARTSAPKSITVQSSDGVAFGRIRVTLGSKLETVRKSIETQLGEFIGESKDFRFAHKPDESSKGDVVLVAKVQEHIESIEDFIIGEGRNAHIFIKTMDFNNFAVTSRQRPVGMRVAPGSPITSMPSTPSNTSPNTSYIKHETSPDSWTSRVSAEHLYNLFGVVEADMIPPDKLTRMNKMFPVHPYESALHFLEDKVFGSKTFEPWFLGYCTRIDAEGYLSSQPKKTFILRFSTDQSVGGIALSIRGDRDCLHGALTQRANLKGEAVFMYNRKMNQNGAVRSVEVEYPTLKNFVTSELISQGFSAYHGHHMKRPGSSVVVLTGTDVIDRLCNDLVTKSL